MDGSFPTLISKDDDVNSPSNPIYVETVNSPETITPVHDFSTQTVNGNGTSHNHDHAVVGSFFRLKSVLCASTAKVKFSVLVGPLATLVTKAVGFTNPNQNFIEIRFDPPILVPVTSTGTIRVIRTNNQNGANDVYSTIVGEDVA